MNAYDKEAVVIRKTKPFMALKTPRDKQLSKI